MKKEHIEYFREVLSENLGGLLNHVNNTVSNMTASIETFLPDPTDRKSFGVERDSLLSIGERKTPLIEKIKEAIDRIENDTYTICKTCGDEISLARLIVRPVSTQCIDCKTKEEAVGVL